MEDRLEETDRQILRGVLRDLPPPRSNTVRIFLSSTFTDYYVERNELMLKVFPELREYCQTNGLDFQVVDMRWGVSEEAGNDHMTSILCMDQIKTCQQLSSGPSFVALLGQRYGYRQIPTFISTAQFEILLEVGLSLSGVAHDMSLLTEWYKQDVNALPPVYVLQEINSILGNYLSSDLTLRKRDQTVWWQTLEKLQNVLRAVATEAHKRGLLDASEKHVYFRSVTEEEIINGMLHQEKDNESSAVSQAVLCFRREMSALGDAVRTDKLAPRFIDCDGDRVDQEAQSLLNDLKYEIVPQQLPRENIHDYKTSWSQHGLDMSFPEHREYLDDFCSDVREGLLSLIGRAVDERSTTEIGTYPGLRGEVLHHSAMCAERCELFEGQEAILENVRTRLGEGKCPLVIYGESGVGKTSLLAKVVDLLPEWMNTDVIRISRFLGTSAGSASVYDTIKGVLEQIWSIGLANRPDGEEEADILNDSRTAANYFCSLCSNIDESVVFVFDAVDQVSSDDGAHQMAWLPVKCNNKVKIIVSVISNQPNIICLDMLRNRLKDDSLFKELSAPEPRSAQALFTHLLRKSNRTLTKEQFQLVSDTLKGPNSPLLVKLLVEEAKRWRSYDSVSNLRLETTVTTAINHLFDNLERKHGAILVSHALAFMTASRRGLSEVEMEDLLSLDDEVLIEVYWMQKPPSDKVLRLPGSLYQRVQYDLRSYITVRQAGGKALLTWYHRQFEECSRRRYLPDSESEQYNMSKGNAHTSLADYFNDTSSSRKSITLKIRGKPVLYDDAERQITPQPLVFAEGHYNIRRLDEACYHLILTGQFDVVFDEMFLLPDWIQIKTEACGKKEVLNDFQHYLKREDNDGVRLIFGCLLRMPPGGFLQFNYEICSRLMSHSEGLPDTVGRLVNRARFGCETDQRPALVPMSPFACETGPLHLSFQVNDDDTFLVPDTRSELYLLTADWDILAYDITSGECLRQSSLGHLHQTRPLHYHMHFNADQSRIFVVAQNSPDDEDVALCCHVVDTLTFEVLRSHVSGIDGYSFDTEQTYSTLSTKLIIDNVDAGEEKVQLLSLPEMKLLTEWKRETFQGFIGFDPSENFVLLQKKRENDHTIDITSIFVGETRDTGKQATFSIRDEEHKSYSSLCTSHGFIHGEITVDGNLCYEPNNEVIIENFDYRSGRTVHEMELGFVPLQLSSSGHILLVHYEQETRVLDLSTWQVTFVIKGPFITHQVVNFGVLLVQDSVKINTLYNLETGKELEKWNGSFMSIDLNSMLLCKDANDAAIYIVEHVDSFYRSLIKVWKAGKAYKQADILPAVTDDICLSSSGEFLVGKRKDDHLYRTSFTGGNFVSTKLSTQYAISMTLSENSQNLALLFEENCRLRLRVYDLSNHVIVNVSDIEWRRPETTRQMRRVDSNLRQPFCVSFASSDARVVLYLPIDHTTATLHFVDILTSKVQECTVYHQHNIEDIHFMYNIDHFNDTIFFGNTLGGEHVYQRLSLHSGEVTHVCQQPDVRLVNNMSYRWFGSPGNFVLFSGPGEFIEPEEDEILRNQLKDTIEEDLLSLDSDESNSEEPGETHILNLQSNVWKRLDINGSVVEANCNQNTFVGRLHGGGMVVVDLQRNFTRYLDDVEDFSRLLTTSRGGALLIYLNQSGGYLTVYDVVSDSHLCQYHFQPDTLNSSNPTRLLSSSDMRYIVLASYGGPENAILTPNAALAECLDLDREPTRPLQSPGSGDPGDASIGKGKNGMQEADESIHIVLGSQLCEIM